MCSINGCVDFCTPHGIDKGRIRAAGRAMAHRGPDAHGEFFTPCVGFYHNRLAVMDPVRGKQPMQATHRGKTYTIVYNGEVYNCAQLRRELSRLGAVFVTECDTEVVLWSYILWGEEAPVHLNGIFAFAVYDPAAEKVFVARDRLGVKPFFYARCGTKFYFASEVKGILAGGIPAEVRRGRAVRGSRRALAAAVSHARHAPRAKRVRARQGAVARPCGSHHAGWV